jgi:hypothetical protein
MPKQAAPELAGGYCSHGVGRGLAWLEALGGTRTRASVMLQDAAA